MDIFNPDPKVNPEDVERLSHWLDNYLRLNEGLVLNRFSTDDLKRMVVIESKGQRREPLLRRLIGRIISAERRRIWKAAIGKTAP
jgi:hypothetical protein